MGVTKRVLISVFSMDSATADGDEDEKRDDVISSDLSLHAINDGAAHQSPITQHMYVM